MFSYQICPKLTAHLSPFCKVQFTCGLLEPLVVKLENDLPEVVYDDLLFSHTMDELLLFLKELNIFLGPAFGQLPGASNILKLISSEPYFSRLLNMEQKSVFLSSIIQS